MDDDYVKAWEQSFDLFDKYGARITFFIQGEYIPFTVKALERGHDVGFHSINHLDLRKVSAEKFRKETVEPLSSYRREGVPLLSFAYPFGFSEPWMHKILLETFSILRGYGTTFRLYNEAEIRSGYIISRAIDNTVIRGEENFNRLITLMLRTVKFIDGGFLPLTTHDISDTALWGISKRRLEFLLKTASELKLKFYLYSDFSK
jgi:peptidoglycan/xylan/chitin deacetylase (PgdA/CDA1 family)